MSSTAAIASKVASADPVAQAKLHVQLKVLEQQRAIQAKQAEEMRKKVEAEERDRKMGKISGFARVKAVNSGDSIVLVGQPLSPGSMPPEKLMTLSGIEAPKIGRGKKADEPFAYASREFLRKLLIGQLVGFSVTQVNEATGRSYGIVTLSDEDVAHLVVASGWAKVKDVKTRNNEIPP